jgi:putative NADH-flavin reductase
MQVTVFGASGKVGRLVVDRLIASGHTVTAFVHKSDPFQDMSGVNVIQGSVSDASSVNRAVNGSDAVISTLGSWASPSEAVVSTGASQIIEAMALTNAQRLVTLTGASAFYSLDKPGLTAKWTRKLLKMIAPKILLDGENHLRSLEGSKLDWTCVRSPAMTSGNSSSYHLSDKLPTLIAFVPRNAVAKCLVDQLEDTNFIKKAPVIYRG